MTFRDFLDHAQKFLDEAESLSEGLAETALMRYYCASLVFSWIALDAFVNDMMGDFAALPVGLFSLHERAFLEEKAVEFVVKGPDLGQFSLSGRREFHRVDQKIMFLIAKFGKGTTIDKGSTWWQKFEASKDKRNKIVHPRKDEPVDIAAQDARDALDVACDVIRVISRSVWGKEADL